MINLNKYLIQILIVIFILSGCGFKIRGSSGTNELKFNTIFVETGRGKSLNRELKRAIISYGSASLVNTDALAEIIIRILSEKKEKKILTLNSQGQVREYSLIYRLIFEIENRKKEKLLAPTELALQTFMSFSESQALAKEVEEKMIYNDLRRDAVSQIIRQLSQISYNQ
tara:strand:- start:182 stop:691 length:510 start_codon:yes stop_codon:yes gene_type:complete